MNFTQEALNNLQGPNNFMLDIEALGGQPNGVVTSIGVLRFIPCTGECLEGLKVNVGIQSCLNAGLKVDGSTIEFWFKQSKEAQDAMLNDPVPLVDALKQVSRFSHAHDPKREGLWWANGANYDFSMMDECYRALAKGARPYMPWAYKNIVDLRTLRVFTGYVAPKTYYKSVGTFHDALDDCKRQVMMVKDIVALCVQP